MNARGESTRRTAGDEAKRVHPEPTNSGTALLEAALEAIQQAARTNKVGDGKIFVSPLDQVVRIRTGELNDDAL